MLRPIASGFLLPALLLLASPRLSAAPSAIADLTPHGTTSSSVTLTWTVSGGEPAVVYDLRCSIAPITGANFADATVVGGLAAPTGGIESHTVSGLFPNTRYWFAAKAFAATDESAISNVAEAWTQAAAPDFAAAMNYALPGTPHVSAGGDFNGDGAFDLVYDIFSAGGNNYLSVLLGNGDGTFAAAANYSTGSGTGTYFVATGDFNGDGWPDLAAANWLGSDVSILLNNGDGTFAAAVDYPVAFEANSVAVGDFDRDGDLDLAVTSVNTDRVHILLGVGDGTFGAATGHDAGSDPLMSVAGDFNRDGNLDLAVANSGSGTVSFLAGNGDGTFQAAVNYATGLGPLGLACGDLNGDGDLDLVASACETDGSVFILLGNGDGSFQAYATHAGGDASSRYASLADINGDGHLDLLCSGTDVKVSLGNGDGTFGTATGFAAGTGPVRTVVAGDFDRDGRPDLAAANNGSSNASVLLNTTDWPPAGSFLSAGNYSSGYHPNYVTAGDLDGDGVLDVVTTSQFTRNFFSVYLGNADGTLGAEAQLGGVLEPHMPWLADFNRDGRLDLAIAELENDRVSIRLGNGDGTFQAPLHAGVADGPVSLVADDFDGDGILDLGVGHWYSNWFAILIGDGDGTFEPAVLHNIGAKSFNPVTADFTGDGIIDIITGNYGLNSLSLFTGVGDGTFTHSYIGLPGNGTPYRGDFNRDGKPDLAVSSNADGGSILVLIGNGDGSFQAPLTNAIGSGNLAVGDLDRDGKPDLVLADSSHASATVLLGLGDGTFAAPTRFATAAGTGDIALGDFNRDGRLDVITSNVDDDSISILLNAAQFTRPQPDNLVAWWRAEDNALDSAGGNHGTLLGGTDFDSGWAGRAFNFNGAAVAVPDGIIPSTARHFTVSAWAYGNASSGSHVVYYGGANAGEYILSQADGSFYFSVNLQGFGFHSASSPSTSSPGAWHLVTGVRRGTELEIWVDGILKASTPIPDADLLIASWNPTGFPSRIGAYHHDVAGDMNFWDGRIDEVKLFDRALAAEEIAALAGVAPNGFRFAERTDMPRSSQVVSDPVFAKGITAPVPVSVVNGEYQINGGGWTDVAGTVEPGDEIAVRLTTSADFATAVAATLTIGGVDGAFTATTASADDPPADGLVAWWRGEDNALDSVGGHHGTITGGTTYTNGQDGRSFEFDGVDSNVGVGMVDGFALNEDRPFTISAWIDTNDPAAHQVITGNYMGEGGGVGNYSTYLRIHDGNLEFHLNKRQVADAVVTTAIGTGWHHLTATYNGDEMRLYLDGHLQGSANRSSFFSGCADNTRGWYHGDYSPETVSAHGSHATFDGRIDELKFYDRALPDEEIEDLSGVVPDAFNFTDQTGIQAHLLTVSEPITVTGIRYPAGISIDVGEYEVNGSGTWLSAPGTVAAGDTVRVLLMSSATYGATVNATVTIGGVSDIFSVTTIEQHTVVFRTDGTEGATVNGAETVSQLVLDGEDCAPVTAVAPPGHDFAGWTGGYTGMDNPLTLTNITTGMTVIANFAMQQVACGSTFEVAADMAGLERFHAKPKVHATYLHPVSEKAGKAAVKVLDKVDAETGLPTVTCEWTKKVKLYDGKAFKAAQAVGIGAAEWITPATLQDLEMDLHVASKEVEDTVVQPLALAVPVIADIQPGAPDPKGNATWEITGDWFGTKVPKAWREYTVPGKAEGTVVIKRQALKVVKPSEDNTAYRDSKGKPACMDPDSGESKVIVVAPAAPKGQPNGTVVLDNGVGLAAGDEP